VACIALITAGALGNVIDCIAYGVIFDDPAPTQVAQFLPPEGGYATLFNGKVVDMLYFPLCEWDWPLWMPWIGGSHFIFFQPIFNIADASLSVSVIALILCYPRYLATVTSKKEEEEETPAPEEGSINNQENSQDSENPE
jgi:signal peptidase II